ncbi:RDD family protein [Nocardioides montaniterrae]
MSNPPAGWYPDPTAPYADPPHMRYWNGAAWTEHASSPPAAGMPPTQGVGTATTPDGVPLSGWWKRVLAYLIDGLVIGVPTLIVVAPQLGDLLDVMRDQMHQAEAHPGMSTHAFDARSAHIFHTMSLHQLPIVLLSLVYFAGMLRWKGATLGKLATGLRVRLREQPGQLPWGAVLRRVGILNGLSLVPSLLGAVGLEQVGSPLGILIGIFVTVDVLWPLWDKNRQALHDKVAGTNVVKVR